MNGSAHLALVGVQRDGVGRHHVRAVEEPGDAAETLRLALGEIAVRRAVHAGQSGVLVGIDADDGFQREGVGQVGDAECAGCFRKWHFFPVDRDTERFQFVTIQNQRLGRDGRVAAHGQRGADGGATGFDVEVEIDGVDQVGGSRVVFEIDGLGRGCFHFSAGCWGNRR